MKDKIYQEQQCLNAKIAIDYLRTALFSIDDFEEFQKYEKILKKLKQKVDSIYWSI